MGGALVYTFFPVIVYITIIYAGVLLSYLYEGFKDRFKDRFKK